MVTIYDNHGRTVRRSKNLAGIIRHAAKVGLHTVALTDEPTRSGYYSVRFRFTNMDNALTEWADWRVLIAWLASRKNACPAYLKLPAMIWHWADNGGMLDALRKRGTIVTMS